MKHGAANGEPAHAKDQRSLACRNHARCTALHATDIEERMRREGSNAHDESCPDINKYKRKGTALTLAGCDRNSQGSLLDAMAEVAAPDRLASSAEVLRQSGGVIRWAGTTKHAVKGSLKTAVPR